MRHLHPLARLTVPDAELSLSRTLDSAISVETWWPNERTHLLKRGVKSSDVRTRQIPVDLERIVANRVETVQYIKKMGGTVKIEGSVIWVPEEDMFTAYDNRNAALNIIYKLGPDVYLYVSHDYIENREDRWIVTYFDNPNI